MKSRQHAICAVRLALGCLQIAVTATAIAQRPALPVQAGEPSTPGLSVSVYLALAWPQPAPSGNTASWNETPGVLDAVALSTASPGPSNPFRPAAARPASWFLAASSADRAVDFSPVDTLHMSILERLFWSRNGLMRVTGLFKLDPETPVNDLRQIARVRRKMLSWHQGLGLATVGAMAATVISGQRAAEGRGSGFHKASIPFTAGLYTTTAVLALASPPKLVDMGGGVDSMTFHKIFAGLHLAGMIITPMLAPDDDEGGSASRRRIHETFGYATFGAFTAGMLVVTLLR